MKRQAVLLCLAAGSLFVGCEEPPPMAVENGEAMTRDFREIVNRAKEKVFPAVVFIRCLRESHEGGKKITKKIDGSGVLISGAGEVLSNWHVVDKAVEIRCLLYDGRAFTAEVVGTDKDTDLSLLKLKRPAGGEPFPYAPLGDSEVLNEGDFVMAMGAPWGLNRSVSIGSTANQACPL